MKNILKHSKNCNWSKRWLYNWLFLDDNCFKKHYRLIAIDLSKQEALDADPQGMQQIIFTGNLEQDGNRTIFFITEETKETILDLSQETERVL